METVSKTAEIFGGERVIYLLLESDVQEIAMEKLDRKLTDEELYIVKKGVESGFGDWDEIVSIAIDCLDD